MPACREWTTHLCWLGPQAQGRVLITHDVSTVTAYAYGRTASGEYMPGVLEVSCSVPLAVTILSRTFCCCPSLVTKESGNARSDIFPSGDALLPLLAPPGDAFESPTVRLDRPGKIFHAGVRSVIDVYWSVSRMIAVVETEEFLADVEGILSEAEHDRPDPGDGRPSKATLGFEREGQTRWFASDLLLSQYRCSAVPDGDLREKRADRFIDETADGPHFATSRAEEDWKGRK